MANIETEDIKIINLTDCKDTQFIKYWSGLTRRVIRKESHSLKENYINIVDDYKKFKCFLLAVDETTSDFISFEGMWNPGVYPPEIARVMTRKYKYPNYRKTQSLSKNSLRELVVSRLTLPIQISIAKKLGLSSVFISRANTSNRVFNQLVGEMNRFLHADDQFKVLEGRYNTCRVYNSKNKYIGVNPDEKCWQKIALLNIDKNKDHFNLPFRSE